MATLEIELLRIDKINVLTHPVHHGQRQLTVPLNKCMPVIHPALHARSTDVMTEGM